MPYLFNYKDTVFISVVIVTCFSSALPLGPCACQNLSEIMMLLVLWLASQLQRFSFYF
uniref:Uncharacterized protein n=1 Tax=Anguilla anguilla TaxID=7936 RepID=A0A0E9XFC4_ANGAN